MYILFFILITIIHSAVLSATTGDGSQLACAGYISSVALAFSKPAL